MKPIEISKDLEQFAKTFFENLFKKQLERKGPGGKFQSPSLRLDNLAAKSKGVERKVVDYIRINLITIMNLRPSEQQRLVNIVNERFLDLFYEKEAATKFSNAINHALRYDDLRKHHGWEMGEKLKIKVCPYCNSALVLTVENHEGEKKAKYQLDHFFPKSKYPFLSISFFNLIPSCGNCNHGKSNDSVILGEDFHLYADETPTNAFHFKIKKEDVVNKIIGGQAKEVEFKFTHTDSKHEKFVKRHNESFHIHGIYNTQKDIVQEMVWKSQAYTKPKITDLSEILKIPEVDIKRLIIGNYSEYDDIHKRPLSKFMQDIATQLELI